jgi:hypothetical protein
MKKLIFLYLAALSLASAAAVRDVPRGSSDHLADFEEATYTETDEIKQVSVEVKRTRQGNVVRVLLEGQEVLKATERSDGRETILESPDSPFVTKIIFPQPIFHLPDGAYVAGKSFEQAKKGGPRREERNIFVRVKKTPTSSVYTYVRIFRRAQEIEKVTYVPTSRLPEKKEIMIVQPEGISLHLTLVRKKP